MTGAEHIERIEALARKLAEKRGMLMNLVNEIMDLEVAINDEAREVGRSMWTHENNMKGTP